MGNLKKFWKKFPIRSIALSVTLRITESTYTSLHYASVSLGGFLKTMLPSASTLYMVSETAISVIASSGNTCHCLSPALPDGRQARSAATCLGEAIQKIDFHAQGSNHRL